ncbi:MAG TPA: pyridoxal-dependent decarboxylase, partial [Anaerolineae bacterium]
MPTEVPLTDDRRPLAEETLDPEDWDAMRRLGHQMVDDMLDWLATVRERPVWQAVPEDVLEKLHRPLPQEGESPEAVYQEFLENVRAYPMGNIHPRFWGWVMGNGTALGMLAEMLAAGMNPNLGGGQHVAIHVERQVMDWTKTMLGYPASASGLLTSGASEANLLGLG